MLAHSCDAIDNVVMKTTIVQERGEMEYFCYGTVWKEDNDCAYSGTLKYESPYVDKYLDKRYAESLLSVSRKVFHSALYTSAMM